MSSPDFKMSKMSGKAVNVSGDISGRVHNVVGDITNYLKLKEQEQTNRTEIIEQGKNIRARIDAIKEISLHAIDSNFAHRNKLYGELFQYNKDLLIIFKEAKDTESKDLVQQMIDANMIVISRTIQGDSSFKGIDIPKINKSNGEDI